MTLFKKQILIGISVLVLTACSTAPAISPENMASIIQALEESTAAKTATPKFDVPPEVTAALLPQLNNESVGLIAGVEQRFDISVKTAEASKFFMSLVKGTTTNMVVHPDVSGWISLSLTDVTLEDVLGTVRDVYGYRYRLMGNTYQVFPASMRTQVFSIDYLDIVRNGNSRTSVNSGEASKFGSGSQPSVAGGASSAGGGQNSTISGRG